MKKKLIRLASLWLAVLMLATTAFAAEITVRIYTGNEPLENGDYPNSYYENVVLSSETDEFSLDVDEVMEIVSESAHGRELLGWKLWGTYFSGAVYEENPLTYDNIEEVFTAEQLSNQLVEPVWSEADIRMFVVAQQYGADHNDIIDMMVEQDMIEVVVEASVATTPPIYHNFTENGAFELTSDEVMSAVKLRDGYVVEGWRIWTMEEEELRELPALDFDAEVESGSELLQSEREIFLLVPVVSKLAEITVQPTSLSPTVETDADDKDELTKEYTWYSADEEIEAITNASDESRLVEYYPDVKFSEDGKKWYAEEENVQMPFAVINMSAGEKLIVTTGSDDEEATPVQGMIIFLLSIDPETGNLGQELDGQEFVLASDGVLEYTAEKDCCAYLIISYGTMNEPAETDEHDYITMDILKRSNISVVEGEAAATLKNGSFGERYFVEVKVSDEEERSIILTSDSFVHGYGITHQPTMDEPYVETNKDEDVLSYAWYQRSAESHIFLDDENEYKLSGGEDGEEYFVNIEFIDGTILTSDYFEWKKPAKKPQGGGGLQAGGSTSTAGADKPPVQTTPITPTIPTTPPTDNNSGALNSNKLFDDAPVGSWFEPAAEWMGQKGYMTGTAPRTFSPNVNTSRAMIVTILWRINGSVEPQGECKFDDVPAGSYYEKAVTWANENGIVLGTSETTFSPDMLVTREQIATILFRDEIRRGMETMTLEENLTRFEDADEIEEYAISAMNWAVGKGIINGVDEDTLAPKKEATRAECAAIFYRIYNN